ncbi:hypothetical protein EVA_18431 [gut metagenome]|uniref:Uncharacterized protein n=1 Tax=gut metagenome TaxID=749906 RepID=J9FEX3_9ZZZZ
MIFPATFIDVVDFIDFIDFIDFWIFFDFYWFSRIISDLFRLLNFFLIFI